MFLKDCAWSEQICLLGGRQCLNVGSTSMNKNSELPFQGRGEKGVNEKTNLAEKVRAVFSICYECIKIWGDSGTND